MDVISNNGNDWNYDQHQKIDVIPTHDDLKKTVADYLSWEVSNVLCKRG
jgi:type I restriction enzyme M protein